MISRLPLVSLSCSGQISVLGHFNEMQSRIIDEMPPPSLPPDLEKPTWKSACPPSLPPDLEQITWKSACILPPTRSRTNHMEKCMPLSLAFITRFENTQIYYIPNIYVKYKQTLYTITHKG